MTSMMIVSIYIHTHIYIYICIQLKKRAPHHTRSVHVFVMEKIRTLLKDSDADSKYKDGGCIQNIDLKFDTFEALFVMFIVNIFSFVGCVPRICQDMRWGMYENVRALKFQQDFRVSCAIAGDAISKRAGGRSFDIEERGKCEEMEVTGYMVCLGYVI